MPIYLSAELEGEQQLSRRLGIIADGVEDFSPALENIEKELLHSVDANFSQRGGLFGGWVPRKDDNPWPLLEKTGELRGGFMSAVKSDYLEIGNSVSYFKYHQSNQPRARLPRRVMLKIDQTRKVFITKAFQEYLVGLIQDQNNAKL